MREEQKHMREELREEQKQMREELREEQKQMREEQKHVREDQNHIRTALHVVTESIRFVHETLSPSDARTGKKLQYELLLSKMKLEVREMQFDELSRIGNPPDTWPQFLFSWSKEFDSSKEAAQATETEGSSEERVASPLPGL